MKPTGLADVGIGDIMRRAYQGQMVIPAYNIAHLPMVEPVARVLEETRSFGLLAVARPDWEKFGAKGIGPVRETYETHANPDFMRLHLDHVPVIDEDDLQVEWRPILREALDLGYESVMVDGSRLSLDENIAATKETVEMAHGRGAPVESELGAVLGHEAGPLPPYEELFSSGKGFTDPQEAERFVKESGTDWLSVAIGSVHGAVSGAARDKEKVAARLSIEHLQRLRKITGVPLVLHGGSGIQRDYVLEAIGNGIAKINIGTQIRQAYERGVKEGGSEEAGQETVAAEMRILILDYFEIGGSADKLG